MQRKSSIEGGGVFLHDSLHYYHLGATMSVNVGDSYKDFTLYDYSKQRVQLSTLIGSNTIVLAFYPGAFTGACDREVCALRDSMARFNDLGATVLGISVDAPFANKEFATKYNLNFNLLCDFDRTVTKDYGVLFHGLGGVEGYDVANRSVFIIDRSGIVRYTWFAAPNPGVEPPYDELISTVESLKS